MRNLLVGMLVGAVLTALLGGPTRPRRIQTAGINGVTQVLQVQAVRL